MLAKIHLLVSKSTVENCLLKNNLNGMLFKYILVNSLTFETWVLMTLKKKKPGRMKESTDTKIGKSIYVWLPTTRCYGISLKEWTKRNSEESRIKEVWEFWVKIQTGGQALSFSFFICNMGIITPVSHGSVQWITN